MGRNKIYNKYVLSNNNIIESIPKISYNHAQKNLSYIKNKDNSHVKKIRLSPIKNNNINLLARPTSANKRRQVYYNTNEINNNKKLNRKILIEKTVEY